MSFRSLFLSLSLLFPVSAFADLLVSNKPLALIAAAVYPAEKIQVLIPDGMTPHDFSLRPSDIRKLRSAKKVLWAGPDSEPFLKSFATDNWINATALSKQAGLFNKDPHVWTSPATAILVAQQLAEPKSAQEFEAKLNQLVTALQLLLQPVTDKGFFVFHDAYSYFFDAIKVKQTGAFTLSPEHKPGARRVQKMRQQLIDGQVQCVLSEPQFEPAILERISSGLSINKGTLDPLASHIALTETGYFEWLQGMANTLHKCLKN